MPDLTTLVNVKNYLQINDGGSDASLSRLITAFSTWMLTQLNRGALLSTNYVEQRNGLGSNCLTLINYPITAILSLNVRGLPVPASDGIIPGYVFDDYTVWMHGFKFERGFGNISIAYTAGYLTVPPDIEQAVIDQVAFTFRRQPSFGATAESMGGQLTTAWSQKDLAPGVQPVLNVYRGRTAVGI